MLGTSFGNIYFKYFVSQFKDMPTSTFRQLMATHIANYNAIVVMHLLFCTI